MFKKILLTLLILTTCASSHAMNLRDLNARTIFSLASVTAALATAGYAYAHDITFTEIPSRLWAHISNPFARRIAETPAATEQQTEQTKPVGFSEYRQQEATTSFAPTHYCPRFAESYRHQAGLLCMPDHIMETICQGLRLRDIASLRRSCRQLASVWDHERELALTGKQVTRMCYPSNLAQGLELLSQRLQSCRNIIQLDFTSENSEVLESLPPQIRLLTNLRRLNLFGNRLSQVAIVNISRWLSQLQDLNLSFNNLEQLPEEIRLLTNLRRLKLAGNRLSQTALVNISRLPQLQELDLGLNGLEQLPEQIRLLTHLKNLNLYVNRLSQTALANIIRWYLNCRNSI